MRHGQQRGLNIAGENGIESKGGRDVEMEGKGCSVTNGRFGWRQEKIKKEN